MASTSLPAAADPSASSDIGLPTGITESSPAERTTAVDVTSNGCRNVTLFDGRQVDLLSLDRTKLIELQCEQEPLFAAAIQATEKDSIDRHEVTSQAYTTICAILEQIDALDDPTALESGFCMGMDQRYSRLILDRLSQLQAQGTQGGFFEVGFSGGGLLSQVAEAGFGVGGLEVVPDLAEQAKQRLPAEFHPAILCGDFRSIDLSEHESSYSLVYWNDVFEHIATDEIEDYLKRIHGLLVPGGQLITITPNWHMRPSDVTAMLAPPRSEPIGFHLKEYTAREVRRLLQGAGFESVQVPRFISRQNIYLAGGQLGTRLKLALEPCLEWLPFPLAVQACRRLGLNCTIATKRKK